MNAPILSNISGKKLMVLIVLLVLCQITCFLIGLIAPVTKSTYMILATKCLTSLDKINKLYYPQGSGRCNETTQYNKFNIENEIVNVVVYSFQMPISRNNRYVVYSPWEQYLIGILQFDVSFQHDYETSRNIHEQLILDLKLGYRDTADADNQWKIYAASMEAHTLRCSINQPNAGYGFECSSIPLFELGTLHHDYYLLNIYPPFYKNNTGTINQDFANVEDLWLTTVTQNADFTKIWLSIKTIFFPCILIVTIWFWKRVNQLCRKPIFLECMLLSLGSTLTLLNLPLEYLMMLFDLQFLVLLGDIRLGLFYTALLSFWLVSAGEIQDPEKKNTLKAYWKHIIAIFIGCFFIVIYDMWQHCIQKSFYSIWITDLDTSFSQIFIIFTGILAGIYFLFLTYMICKVFCNIGRSTKHVDLPTVSTTSGVRIISATCRYKCLTLITLVCAALTVIFIVNSQVSEAHWKWDEKDMFLNKPVFIIGIYGMWNVHIFGVMILYAPSCKQESQSINCGTDVKDNEVDSAVFFVSREANKLTP